MEKVFRALIAKEKVFHSSAVEILQYLQANTKQAQFCWLLLRSGIFPFRDISPHYCCRSFFFSCLRIFLVEFPLLYFAFSITFFAVLSRTVG